MPRSKRIVTNTKRVATDRLPEWASEGAVLVEWLVERGLLEEIGERLKIQREGGYVGLDVVLFILFCLTARLDGGIKGFDEHAAPHRQQLGALGDRRAIPSRSSVSRVLAATHSAHTEDLSEWLLFDGCGARALLDHESVIARDAVGARWQVFDLDPTVTVLRQRALPDLDDLPPADRRSSAARPGYSGRKRGDVQLSRMTLQHAGSSLWMGLWTASGNGNWREHSDAAIRRVRTLCDRLDHPADHALVRMDGAGGNVPLITSCQEAGVRYLTRWSHYEILDEAEIRRHLNTASWFAVGDSGSGPRREAAEIGWMTQPAAASTVREDGSSYAPVRPRIIVSRFQAHRSDKKRGAGILIDGWQYELYATDLPSDAWPAQDAVTTYYGRCGQENRLCQEDRTIGLDHIFSYAVPGQQLANLVGLFLWNLRVCRGFELADVPPDVPLQAPRTAAAVAPGVLFLVEDPTLHDEPDVCAAVAPGIISSAVPDLPLPSDLTGPNAAMVSGVQKPVGPAAKVPPVIEPEGSIVGDTPPETEPTALGSIDPTWLGNRDTAREALRRALNGLEWPMLLRDRPGWRWDPEAGLFCTNDTRQNLQSVKVQGRDQTRQLRFLAPYLACAACSLRSGCTDSSDPIFRKETAVTVPTAIAYPIHHLHQYVRGRAPPPTPSVIPPATRAAAARRTETPRPRTPAPSPPVPVPVDPTWAASWREPGAFAVNAAILLPAKLRHIFASACRALEVHVRVRVPARKSLTKLFAVTDAERQCRRLTWAERLRWNAFPDDGEVTIQFAGGDDVAPVLRHSSGTASASSAA